MAGVQGIGGIFFKSSDPKASAEWYARVLGVKFETWGGAKFAATARGDGVFCPFAADTTYFEPGTQPFMINLLVDDLDGVLARAEAEGVVPTGREDGDPNGRFAWVVDPDGVKLELWQPAG
jgi:predicted enzyme related to lactoylglutathione lyase